MRAIILICRLSTLVLLIFLSLSIEIFSQGSGCDNPFLITNITPVPPTITFPTCIKFDEGITEIPKFLYKTSTDADKGNERGVNNITGIIGEQIERVGYNAFRGAPTIELVMPNVRFIDQDAFILNQLTFLSLPSADTIHSAAFAANPLTELSLPNIKKVYDYAFYNNQIIELSLPSTTFIGYRAFINNQIVELSLPSADTIYTEAFKNNLIVNLSLPSAETIYNEAFMDNQIKTVHLPKCKEIVHKQNTTWGDNAFKNNQIIEVYVPALIVIPYFTFANNPNLKKITVGKALGYVWCNAFDKIVFPTLEVYCEDCDYENFCRIRDIFVNGCGCNSTNIHPTNSIKVEDYDNEEDNVVTIVPNPIIDVVELILNEVGIIILDVSLLDIEGKILRNFISPFTQLDIRNIHSGNYFLKIKLSNNKTLYKKIIINK